MIRSRADHVLITWHVGLLNAVLAFSFPSAVSLSAISQRYYLVGTHLTDWFFGWKPAVSVISSTQKMIKKQFAYWAFLKRIIRCTNLNSGPHLRLAHMTLKTKFLCCSMYMWLFMLYCWFWRRWSHVSTSHGFLIAGIQNKRSTNHPGRWSCFWRSMEWQPRTVLHVLCRPTRSRARAAHWPARQAARVEHRV